MISLYVSRYARQKQIRQDVLKAIKLAAQDGFDTPAIVFDYYQRVAEESGMPPFCTMRTLNNHLRRLEREGHIVRSIRSVGHFGTVSTVRLA